MSQSGPPLIAASAASTIVSAEIQIARRTNRALAWELVSAMTEVALVATVRITADQPRLSSSEAST